MNSKLYLKFKSPDLQLSILSHLPLPFYSMLPPESSRGLPRAAASTSIPAASMIASTTTASSSLMAAAKSQAKDAAAALSHPISSASTLQKVGWMHCVKPIHLFFHAERPLLCYDFAHSPHTQTPTLFTQWKGMHEALPPATAAADAATLPYVVIGRRKIVVTSSVHPHDDSSPPTQLAASQSRRRKNRCDWCLFCQEVIIITKSSFMLLFCYCPNQFR